MKNHLARNKPTLYESDNTFGTQYEGYKTWYAVFCDHFKGIWEVASKQEGPLTNILLDPIINRK